MNGAAAWKVRHALDSYRIFRHRTVYGLEILIDRVEAEEALGTAKEFIERMEKLVEARH